MSLRNFRRFEALSIDPDDKPDKPDSKADFSLAGLGSPISPLRTRTNVSSSSSSSGSAKSPAASNAVAVSGRSGSSGEYSVDGNPRGHRRVGSGPLIYSGGNGSRYGGDNTTASSPATNVLPAGNICPHGRVPMAAPRTQVPRSDPHVLGSGTTNYGHGSIMRGPGPTTTTTLEVSPRNTPKSPSPANSNTRSSSSSSKEEVEKLTRAGNEYYWKGKYMDALRYYDKAVEICGESSACRGNRGAALVGLNRLGEAIKEYELAVRLDPASGRAHGRLAGLCLRLGLIEKARRHFTLLGQELDPAEWQKLQVVEKHLAKCTNARKVGDWKSALREADAVIAAGADSSPLVLALRAESLLRLRKLEEADSSLKSSPKLESSSSCGMPSKIFGMLDDAYVYIVRAQVDMAFGRFDDAVDAAERARLIDHSNVEVGLLLNNVRLVAEARGRGNELYKSGKYSEACIAYGEGLKYEPSNSVLYCNRAACWSMMGEWGKSVEDCNEALRIRPNYSKALGRRAASNEKLERWVECVRDYEGLQKEFPRNTEIAESLFRCKVKLKTSQGKEVSNMMFGGEVEVVTALEQLRAAKSLPGVCVVYFMAMTDQHCMRISPRVDKLCKECPTANFLKVDVNESPAVAKAENVLVVPTFKIYKDGSRPKEMICPDMGVLESSVRHYIVSSS